MTCSTNPILFHVRAKGRVDYKRGEGPLFDSVVRQKFSKILDGCNFITSEIAQGRGLLYVMINAPSDMSELK